MLKGTTPVGHAWYGRDSYAAVFNAVEVLTETTPTVPANARSPMTEDEIAFYADALESAADYARMALKLVQRRRLASTDNREAARLAGKLDHLQSLVRTLRETIV